MSTTLPTHLSPVEVLPSELAAPVAQLLEAAKRPNTLRAYRSDWRAFTSWCERTRLTALPAQPQTVAAYIADRQLDLAPSTLQRHVASISTAHKTAGHLSPCESELLRTTMQGLRATHKAPAKRTGRKGKAPALTAEQMRRIVDVLGNDPASLRDRAVLLLGYKAALRRSELAGLSWESVEMLPEGIVLHLHNTKTDRQHSGQRVAVVAESGPYCAVQALTAWRTWCTLQADTQQGAVFRSVNKHMQLGDSLSAASVGAIVSTRAGDVGLEGVTAHSLRRGHLTEAHRRGRSEADLMHTSRHKSVSVLRGYLDDADLFARATGKGLL